MECGHKLFNFNSIVRRGQAFHNRLICGFLCMCSCANSKPNMLVKTSELTYHTIMGNERYTLFDDFEYKGKWWLPENTDRKVAGILSVQKRNITLNLFDSLKESENPLHFGGGEVFCPDIINGITDNGKLCTLLKTFQSSSIFHSSGMQKESYVINFLLVGDKMFDSIDEVKFSSVLINYTCLEEWLAKPPFTVDYKKKMASFVAPESFEIYVDSLKAQVALSWELIMGSQNFRSLKWDYTAFIKITPNDSMSHEGCLEVVNSFGNLLALFIGEAVYPRSIKACVGEIRIGDGKKMKQNVEMFYCLLGDKVIRSIRQFDIIIPFSVIRENITEILQNWHVKSSLLEPSCNLLLSSFYKSKTYIKSLFLSLVQALESFHRRKYDGKYLEEQEYAKYKKILTDALPSKMPRDLKTSLWSRLKYGNEYALRKRIAEIFKSFQPDTVKLITDDPKSFIESVVDTRNYLTHYDKEIESNSLNGVDLYYTNERLSILLIVLLLREIGIEEKTLIQRIKMVKRYSNLKNWRNL